MSGLRLRALCFLLASLSVAVSSAAEAPQRINTFYFTVNSWKGMTFSVNIRGEEVLYRCALNGDEALTRWTAFKADKNKVRELFVSLAELKVFDWKTEYITSMSDGEGWYLIVDAERKYHKIVGSNSQPENFPALVDRVALFLGRLPFGFSGVVPHTKEAEDCLRFNKPLRNYIATSQLPR